MSDMWWQRTSTSHSAAAAAAGKSSSATTGAAEPPSQETSASIVTQAMRFMSAGPDRRHGGHHFGALPRLSNCEAHDAGKGRGRCERGSGRPKRAKRATWGRAEWASEGRLCRPERAGVWGAKASEASDAPQIRMLRCRAVKLTIIAGPY